MLVELCDDLMDGAMLALFDLDPSSKDAVVVS